MKKYDMIKRRGKDMSSIKIVLLSLGLMFLFNSFANAQLSGGGELNPDLKAPEKAQKEFMDRRIGLSVHWGPSSLGGKEISWSRGKQIPKKVYDNYYKKFNPIYFDAGEWVKLMKRWGIRYMAPTGKHHDGFSLWYSKYTDYDMKNAKRPIDIMAELAKACEKNDIWFGSYYSNLDWYHPDWHPQKYGGPGDLIPAQDDSPKIERYFQFMQDQVLELINNYRVKFVQFDGEWDSTYTHEVGSRLYRKFREADPNVLLSSRIDKGRISSGSHVKMNGKKYAGDYQERERVAGQGNSVLGYASHPWQAWVTIDKGQWSYRPKPDLLSVNELIIDLVSTVGHNGNYMINLGPRPDGAFEPEQIDLMDRLGKWILKHSEAIYGTRGGPFFPSNKQAVSTHKGKNVWLFITDKHAKSLLLIDLLERRVVSAKVFGTNKEVSFSKQDEKITFDISKIPSTDPVRVIELEFDREVNIQR